MTNITKIIVETTVAAPIDAVWQAWNTPADIKQWNAASDDWHTTKSEVDLRVGGVFSSRMEAKDGSMGFDFAGTYTRVEKNRLIGSEFGGRRLLVEFIPTANAVTVRETFDAEATHPVEQQRQGWQSILNNFAKHVAAKQPASQTSQASASARGSSGEKHATAKNTICIWYEKDAEAAARFYAATFPDSAIRAVHLAPSDYPSGKKGDVLTVEFTVAGVPCLGLNGGPAIKQSEAFSFQIATDDQQETDRYWNAIVGNGGQESACGWCKDKWGVSWQITPRVLNEALAAGGDEAKRAFEAMMGMKKIDVAVIKAARRG